MLLKITAYIRRACNRFAGRPVPSSPTITTEELSDVMNFWLVYTQQLFFEHEAEQIRDHRYLDKGNRIAKLLPFIDEIGIIRVGGRLSNAPVTYGEQHQAIIPRRSKITTLIIRDAHLSTHHGGTQLTLAKIRQKYWVIGGRAPVRSFILNCVVCARYRARRAEQLMGQLPINRVKPARAFLQTGVDFAGPFNILRWRGSGAVTYKGYIAVFVCFTTSATHLELVTDASTDTFIAAYKRFAARRGIPQTITSDNGKVFHGTNHQLQALLDQASRQHQDMATILASNGTQWKFIPPHAPHFGGKWEAAVKSTKFHLNRVIGDSTLTYEELTTLLCQIEPILNSRSLCPLTNDPEDVTALTPGHFLIGEPTNNVPEPSLEDINQGRLNRWQMISRRCQQFWSCWRKEYLQRYQAINKWMRPSNDIKVGSMVLIVEENYPPAKWALARVLKLIPGEDGHTRVVQLKPSTQIINRAIHKLILLPINPDVEEPEIQRGNSPGDAVEDEPQPSTSRRPLDN